jgi:acetyl-CoA carboxylase biotin carboxyl carrier protein
MKKEDIEDLRQLIEFLKLHQVAEFDVDRGDLKIRLKFNPQESGPATLGDLARLLRTMPQAPAPAAAATHAPEPAAETGDGLHLVKSPIVGTFYAAPSPGADPFVALGERVEKGKTICVVEAMKLMNEIEADVAGVIVKCLVENGQAVEYGQPLFSMRTA